MRLGASSDRLVAKSPGIFEQLVVGFAHACAGLGLLTAFALGLLAVLFGNGFDSVLTVVGHRSTAWWVGALGAWLALAGLCGIAMWRRERASRTALEPKTEEP